MYSFICIYFKSNSFKWDFHGAVNFFVILWNWFDVGVPSIFSSDLLNSLLLASWNPKSLCKSVVCSLRVTSLLLSSTFHISSSWRLGHLVPLNMWLSQERNGICKLLRFLYLSIVFPFIRDISVQNKRCGINRSLECALSWSHWRSILWFILYAHCLNSFSCDRLWWSILSEKFRIGHSRVVEGNVIVHWSVKILSVGDVSSWIVFRALNIKVWDPSKLTIDISVFWDSRIIWHPSSLDFIHLIWIMFSSWLNQNCLLRLESFIKILFVVSVICFIEERWTMVMSLVPLIIIWGKHAIVSIFLDYQFGSIFDIAWILRHISMSSENIGKSFSS